jgi:cytochrome c oxidase subunit IV
MAATPEDFTHAEKEHHTSAGRYVLIWVILLVATGTTVATGRMDLGHYNLPLAMLIATIKATLVVLFFMHLSEQKGANRIVFVTSVFFVLLLLALSLGDVATRFPLTNPPSGQNVRAPGYHHQTDADVKGPNQQPGSKDLPY